MKSPLVPLLGSFLLHGVLFFGVSSWWIQKPQWSVDSGEGGGSNSTEAVQVTYEESASEPQIQEELVEPVPSVVESEFSEPIPVLEKNPAMLDRVKKIEVPRAFIPSQKPADNLSQKDSTRSSGSGARMVSKADYLRNPSPLYPASAKRRGEEGTVLLLIDIDTRGEVESLKIVNSSGFRELDEAAKKTVSRWKFQPAQVGGIAIACSVKVPIVFELQER